MYTGPPLVNQQEADVSTGQDQQEAKKGFCTGPAPVPYGLDVCSVPFLGLAKSTIKQSSAGSGEAAPGLGVVSHPLRAMAQRNPEAAKRLLRWHASVA